MSKANRETRTKLFGTDGIRSAFGEYPLDGASIIKLGEAVGRCMGKSRIVIGRDTRRSGEEIVGLLASG
ncbi:MAG: phosphoglucosamine mutase, partial [bacterium]|nr:phosphoglucosamine mutase [bacterium]